MPTYAPATLKKDTRAPMTIRSRSVMTPPSQEKTARGEDRRNPEADEEATLPVAGKPQPDRYGEGDPGSGEEQGLRKTESSMRAAGSND